MKKTTITFLIIFSCSLFAQVKDTVSTINNLNTSYPSTQLKDEIRKLKAEIDNLHKIISEKSNSSYFSNLLDTNKVNNFHEEQFSKRKRLDSLLNELDQIPGQIKFSGTSLGLIQSNFAKNNNNGIGLFDLYAHTNLGDNTLFFSAIEFVGGNGLTGTTKSFLPFYANEGSTQNNEGFDNFDLIELWVESKFIDERIIITAGKIDLTNYFDINNFANDETTQFISGAFVNNGTIPFYLRTPGIILHFNVNDILHLQAALASEDNSGDELFSNLIRSASIGLILNSANLFESNIRFYGYNFSNLKKSFGYGLSVDCNIANVGGIFARFGQNNSEFEKINPIEYSYSIGFSRNLENTNPKIDLGLGISANKYFKNGFNDYIAEFYTRIKLNDFIFASPHLQYYSSNDNGKRENDFIFGLRTQFLF